MYGGCIGSFMVCNLLWLFIKSFCVSAVYLCGVSLFSALKLLYRFCFRLDHIVVVVVVIVVGCFV